MGEVVNVIVAFAVIVFLFRWVTSGGDSGERSAADVLGFRPKNVTPEMVDRVHTMFLDIPPENIRYDLLRTGSVEVTTNKILEKGFLDAPPPAYYTLYQRTPQPTDPSVPAARPAPATGVKPAPKTETLITRYHLESAINSGMSEPIRDEDVGGKAVWEDSPEKREASLRERKAKMILAARQRLLAQQPAAAAARLENSARVQ